MLAHFTLSTILKYKFAKICYVISSCDHFLMFVTAAAVYTSVFIQRMPVLVTRAFRFESIRRFVLGESIQINSFCLKIGHSIWLLHLPDQ